MIKVTEIEKIILNKAGFEADEILVRAKDRLAVEIIRDLLNECAFNPRTIDYISEKIKTDYIISDKGSNDKIYNKPTILGQINVIKRLVNEIKQHPPTTTAVIEALEGVARLLHYSVTGEGFNKGEKK
jgi:hypothetical protein